MSKVACDKRESCPDSKKCQMSIPHDKSEGCSDCHIHKDAKCVPLEVHTVKILRSQKSSDWYHNKIGQNYEVTVHDSRYPPWKGDHYNLVGRDGGDGDKFIRVGDCIIL